MAKRVRESKQTNKKNSSYQDYVIFNGQLVGDWEGLYQKFEDPWQQSRSDHIQDSRRVLALSWCNILREKYKINRVIELGCGFGFLTNTLRQNNFSAVGTDVSRTAIEKARNINPSSVFINCAINDFETLAKFDADIYLMAEITWYILDDLEGFLSNLKELSRKREKPIFLIHLLTTYAPGIQKYGADKFTNLDEILKYFNLQYFESGFIKTPRENDENSQGTFFVGKI